MTIEIGRLCVKIAGRDAGKKCLIIDILDDKYVLIDGETRRRRCNILHLEPLSQVLKIEKDATHGDVARALKEISIEARQTKPKQKTERPKKKRKTPEQLRVQREEKKKLRDFFKIAKKEKAEENKETTLEEKAWLKTDGAQEEKKIVEGDFKVIPPEEKETKKKEPVKKAAKKAEKKKE